MTSAFEQLLLYSFNFNDGSLWFMEDLVFNPAGLLPQYASNAEADGEELVREPHYSNSSFELQIRLNQAADMDTALKSVGELMDILQRCARTRGGLPLQWTPAGASRSYTWYAVLAELVEVPITPEGELAGWFIRMPVLKIKLTCRPFGYREERVILEPSESAAEPIQVSYIGGVEGDVPAEARLLVTDKATQTRRYLAWGLDTVTSKEGNPSSLLLAKNLIVEGFSGESKKRSGAFSSEEVIRGTALAEATTLCGTGVTANVGSFRILGRFYVTSANARVRASYRNGDGQLIPLEWKEPSIVEGYCQIDLGEVTFAAAKAGTQRSEIRVEIMSAGAACTVDLNYLELLPTMAGYGVATGEISNSPTKLLAYDEFEQTEGALKEKSLNLGGKWEGAGDADDFKVIAANDNITRVATSDADLNTGRYAIAGTTKYTSSVVSVQISASDIQDNESKMRFGVFLRYIDTSNWVMAALVNSSKNDHRAYLAVIKRVAGTVTTIAESEQLLDRKEFKAKTVTLSAYANGNWSASAFGTTLEGYDSVLATGGTLAEGKLGIYDAWTEAAANTRTYKSFSAYGTEEPDRVCYSGKLAEVRYDGFQRQDSTGTYYGPASLYRGASFFLKQAGSGKLINRLVLAMRRNNVTEEEDGNVTDKHSIEALVKERFLIPR